jgi:tetraacyldisaccharide 4'-kinase
MSRPYLLPLVPLYAAGAALRSAALLSGLEKVKRLNWPVISVGNLSAGGTGKTPFTVALAELLTEAGMHVDVLSRGYGRKSSEVVRVKEGGSAEDFGDEPLLIAREADVPVYVGASRYAAGRLAEREAEHTSRTGVKDGSHVHLLDDGFQHRQLYRDIDIVLLNSQDWFRDGLLPAGNLREPRKAIERANVIAIPADELEIEEDLRKQGLLGNRQVWRFRRKQIVPVIPESLAVRPMLAFCGIARPQQFFQQLESHSIQISSKCVFPDHHRYTSADVERLRQAASRSGAGSLITTAKDLTRLGDLAIGLDNSQPLFAARLKIEFEDAAAVRAFIQQAVHKTKDVLA